jgi:hypothetical protein
MDADHGQSPRGRSKLPPQANVLKDPIAQFHNLELVPDPHGKGAWCGAQPRCGCASLENKPQIRHLAAAI